MPDAAKPTALIVEDEDLLRMIAVAAFLEAGFEVLEAVHAAHALDVHAEAPEVHLLFTDVNMPGELNGVDLAERLKAADPNLRVIIVSALPIVRPVEHIPATFVTKPYDLNEVTQTARMLLAA